MAGPPGGPTQVAVVIELTGYWYPPYASEGSEPNHDHTFEVTLHQVTEAYALPTTGSGSTLLAITSTGPSCDEAVSTSSPAVGPGNCQLATIHTNASGDSDFTTVMFNVEPPANVNAAQAAGAAAEPYQLLATIRVVPSPGFENTLVSMTDMTVGPAPFRRLTYNDASGCTSLNDNNCHCVFGEEITGDETSDYACQSRHGVDDIAEYPVGGNDQGMWYRLWNGDFCVVPHDESTVYLGVGTDPTATWMPKFGAQLFDATYSPTTANFGNRDLKEDTVVTNDGCWQQANLQITPPLAQMCNAPIIYDNHWPIYGHSANDAWGDCSNLNGDYVGFTNLCTSWYLSNDIDCQNDITQAMTMACRTTVGGTRPNWDWRVQYTPSYSMRVEQHGAVAPKNVRSLRDGVSSGTISWPGGGSCTPF